MNYCVNKFDNKLKYTEEMYELKIAKEKMLEETYQATMKINGFDY